MPEHPFRVAASCCVLILICLLAFCQTPLARSALSPRHSGLEPPDSPRSPSAMPAAGRSSGIAGGAPGYQDAYGNPLGMERPDEKKAAPRPRPGAYGGYGRKAPDRPLPDPESGAESPAWTFR